MSRSERMLYFSIWALILVFAGLWSVFPREENVNIPEIRVELGSGLKTWFSKADIIDVKPSSLLLRVELKPAYLKTLVTRGLELPLGYHLVSTKGEFSGAVLLPVRARSFAETILPNPNRLNVTQIEIFPGR